MKTSHQSVTPVLLFLLLAISWSSVAAPVHLVDESPVSMRKTEDGVVVVDFGKVAFGNLKLTPSDGAEHALTVHFGEDAKDGRVNRKPPGTVRYAMATVSLKGKEPLVVAPPPDGRNTSAGNATTPPAVRTPKEWGVVLPFRWVEIEGWPAELAKEQIARQSAFATTWDDQAASFESSDEMLNRIWELCRYSIKATTFAGVYVDGDRERIPYEADAYLNQLSRYACDNDVQMARDTFDWLMKHPTWPTEWAFHMIFMAHADFYHTGDTKWLAARYDSLAPKLLLERAREDGLLVSNAEQVKKTDIVDWPKAERDGYVFKPVNTVVNAFHIRSLEMMAEMAGALGKSDDAGKYRKMAERARGSFQKVFFDAGMRAYRDGEGADHFSQHASLFPLAFGLVPVEHRPAVAEFTAKRGMACSVYAAQYLMEGLFAHGQGARALDLMTAPTDRSWRHMVESGATITWEAWDMKYKPNQDWNHAWGAAPANLLPRFVLGVQPLEAGWKKTLIRPEPGKLAHAKGKVPTPRGPIFVEWDNSKGFRMTVKGPEGMSVRVELPATPKTRGVTLNGKPVPAKESDGRWVVETEIKGEMKVAVE